jgi:hypothetical protein
MSILFIILNAEKFSSSFVSKERKHKCLEITALLTHFKTLDFGVCILPHLLEICGKCSVLHTIL